MPAGYEFVLYLHGPFSFDLRKELANLSAGLVLDLESHERYGPSFMLGHWGNQAAQDSDAYQEEIDFVAEQSVQIRYAYVGEDIDRILHPEQVHGDVRR